MCLCISHACAYFTSGNRREVSTSTSSAILNISRSPPTLLRLRMPYFLVLVSHVRTSYACAYRTSENQALAFSRCKHVLSFPRGLFGMSPIGFSQPPSLHLYSHYTPLMQNVSSHISISISHRVSFEWIWIYYYSTSTTLKCSELWMSNRMCFCLKLGWCVSLSVSLWRICGSSNNRFIETCRYRLGLVVCPLPRLPCLYDNFVFAPGI